MPEPTGEQWEAWGGPLDGEVLTMMPGQYERPVYRARKTGTVIAWEYGADKPRVEDWDFLGIYMWIDPSRLGWQPAGVKRGEQF